MARHIVITAAGTGSGMWNTAWPQPAAVAAALDPNRFFWQPLGNYPASLTGPEMDQSANDGVDETVRLVNEVYPPGNPIGNTIVLLGYSQGAMVISRFMRNEVINPNGRCHARRADIICVATWGNPQRLPGFASGNEFAGWPMPADRDGAITGGISGPDNLKPEDVAPPNTTVHHYWGEFVNTLGGNIDLYTENPCGPPSGSPAGTAINVGGPPWGSEPLAGTYETQIYNLVIKTSVTSLFAFVLDIFHLFGATVFPQVIGIAEAIWNGGMFAAAGPGAAHYTYDISPIITFVNLAGTETPPR